jgi:membrane associated rhomboid family serine protease
VSLTNLLVLVNVAAYVWEVATGGGPDYASSLFTGPHGGPVNAGLLYGPAVLQRGEWYRLASAAFLHANLTHIAFNMIALYQVGNVVERLLGRWRFIPLYAIVIGGSGMCVVVFTYDWPTLGASGAIFGLFGALVAIGLRLGRRGRELVRSVIPVIVLNLVFTFTFPGISAAAHVGGLITGFVAGFFLFMMAPRRREVVYAYAYPARNDPNVLETIEHPPDAGPHEEENAPPLELRDPRE